MTDRCSRTPADLLDLAMSEPAEARRRATEALKDSADDDRVSAVLWRVVGLAHRVERRPAEAVEALQKSVSAADRAADPRLRGLALLSLALAETYLGETTRAKAIIDAAVADLKGIERADARFQRALILQYSGAYDDALLDYRAALPVFRAAGRKDWVADLLTNRGILHAYRGNHWQAGRDFERARETFSQLSDRLGMASMGHNLAWLTTLRGEVVPALAAYDRAEQELLEIGFPVETVAMDHCEAMTAAGLFNDSADRAALAVEELAGRGMVLAEAETLVILAEACAYAGDFGRGRPAARRALVLLEGQDNKGWQLRARLADLRLDHEGTGLSDRSANSIVEALEAIGLSGWAREAKILVARHQIRQGRLADAAELLSGLSPGRLPPELEVQWWLARAELYRSQGKWRSAVRAAGSGVRAVRRRQEMANTSEVRAHIGRQLGGLASIGVEHSIASDRPAKALEWLEELNWTPPPPQQPPDSAGRRITFELRAITHELLHEHAVDDPDRRRGLVARQKALHRRLRASQEDGRGRVDAAPPLDIAGLADSIQLRAYAVREDRIYCIENRDRRLRIVPLGSVPELFASLRQLDFDLRSVMRSGGSESRLRRLAARADAVDGLLGHPGRGDGESIVVHLPSAFGAVPLGVLPSLQRRRLLLASSLRIQQGRADRGGAMFRRALAVSGPDLGHAEEEVAAVSRCYVDTTVLCGPSATCAETLREMSNADVVHFAVHGRRSPDHPFFDALQLADGPLFTHELDWLDTAPKVVILASCESAVDHSLDESQRLGLMPSLDRVGVWRTIASVYQLPDNEATVSVMAQLHRRLSDSGDPVGALAASVVDPGLTDQARAIASSLICRGRPGSS